MGRLHDADADTSLTGTCQQVTDEPLADGRPHRRVRPAEEVTFETVFAGYEGGRDGWRADGHDDGQNDADLQRNKAWLDGKLVGAEKEAWE